MALTYYDFFAGGGMAGVGLGPHWRCAFANDINEIKALAYRTNHQAHPLTVKDVRQVEPSEIPGQADLVWASFPCQDLSLAGGGAGLKGQRSGTFWPFWHLVRALDKENRAPRIIVLENVCGVLTSNEGRDFATIASAFSGRNYRFGAIVIDAIRFVPQSRPRVFLIGVRGDVMPLSTVLGVGPSEAWHPKALLQAHARLSKTAASKWLWWQLPQPPHRNTQLSDLIEHEPTGVEWHSSAETEYLLELMAPLHLAKVKAAARSGKRVVGTIYRRTRPDANGDKMQRAEVRFDNVAGCLRTPSGGSSRQTILVVEGHQVRSRLLSPREAARLMGLPDEYRLPHRYNDAYHLAGDGVVVPVVRYIADHIVEPLIAAAGRQGSLNTARRRAR